MNNFIRRIAFLLASIALLCPETKAQYDIHFDNQQLRIDYYIYGNADTCYYALDKYVIEPVWGGTRSNLIDSLGYGDYYFEVLLHDSDVVLYSRGYCNLFGEWQTTPEAEMVNRGFNESVIMPYPKEIVDVVFYMRDYDGNFVEMMRLTVDPDNYFIQDAPRHSHSVLNVHGDYAPEKAVDIVILPDGYTAEEMGKFVIDCNFFRECLFSYEPYISYQDRFNIRAVMAPSKDSGITIPAEDIWKNTVLNCSFYTFDSERYCMSYDNQSIRDLAGTVPYDQIYILANTSKYGGGGIYNFYCVSSTDDHFSSDVIIHEFGHGFAGLGDEYYDDSGSYEEFYNLDIEPWEPNITTLVDFDSKWKDMLKKKTPVPTPDTEKYDNEVGVFEGGGYEPQGVYRPKRDCLMKTFNGDKFCEVCHKAIEKMILYYTE
ncbi:MAG: peptidase M64 [Bacteroidales bacterium]|nr:peptidase M64 [Bacteroidales bacterium]